MTKGLIKSNLKQYFYKRENGYSHEDAIDSVINSRYFFSDANRETVKLMFNEIKKNRSEDEGERNDLRELIFLIYRFEYEESNAPSYVYENTDIQILKYFEKICNKMIKKYGVSLK